MYSDKLKKQVIRAAKKGSIPKAAREFGISSNTIRLWLNTETSETPVKNRSTVSRPKKAVQTAGITTDKKSEILGCNLPAEQFTAQQQIHRISILFKKFCMDNSSLPQYLIVAYDSASSLVNFCFAFEKSKFSKMLYIHHLNSFFKSGGIEQPVFLCDYNLPGVTTDNNSRFSRMIDYRISRIISRFTKMVKNPGSQAELLVKSFVFLADYNLNIHDRNLIHPPFVIEDNISSFCFESNTMQLRTISENIRKSILLQTEKVNQVQLNTEEMNLDRLFKIYNYFSRKGIASKQMENQLINNVISLQRMGELKKSEEILGILLAHKALPATTRNRFYLYYGMQKLRNGEYGEARKYYLKSIHGSRKNGDLSVEFEGLSNLCSFFLHQGINSNAYRYLRLAQHLANRLDDNTCLTKSWFITGYYNYATGNYKEAASAYLLSVEYAKKWKSSYYYNYALSEAANSYIELKNYKKALYYARLSLKGNLRDGLKIPLSNSYFFCAKSYFFLDKPLEALKYSNLQLDTLAGLNYQVMEFLGRELLVRILFTMNKIEEAKEQFRILKTINSQVDNKYIHLYFDNLRKETGFD